jgi:hypothetical protein
MEMGAGREDRSRVIIVYDKDDKIQDVQKVEVGKGDEAKGN